MYEDSNIVSNVIKLPVCAMVPIMGGIAPTTAPTNVFHLEFYFMGKYTHKYENHIAFDTTHVYGANCVYANNDAMLNAVPMKHPFFELMLPLGMGLLCVRTIIASY